MAASSDSNMPSQETRPKTKRSTRSKQKTVKSQDIRTMLSPETREQNIAKPSRGKQKSRIKQESVKNEELGPETNHQCENSAKPLRVNGHVRVKNETQNGRKSHLITDYFPSLSHPRKRLTTKELAIQQEKLALFHVVNKCDPVESLGIEDIPGKGKGIVALQRIPKNNFICEYSGDLIELEEAKVFQINICKVGFFY